MASWAAMKKPKVEQQGEEAEANTVSTQIPDDKEGLIDFMDQRAKSIESLKDQLSILDRKVLLFSLLSFPFLSFALYVR